MHWIGSVAQLNDVRVRSIGESRSFATDGCPQVKIVRRDPKRCYRRLDRTPSSGGHYWRRAAWLQRLARRTAGQAEREQASASRPKPYRSIRGHERTPSALERVVRWRQLVNEEAIHGCFGRWANSYTSSRRYASLAPVSRADRRLLVALLGQGASPIKLSSAGTNVGEDVPLDPFKA